MRSQKSQTLISALIFVIALLMLIFCFCFCFLFCFVLFWFVFIFPVVLSVKLGYLLDVFLVS